MPVRRHQSSSLIRTDESCLQTHERSLRLRAKESRGNSFCKAWRQGPTHGKVEAPIVAAGTIYAKEIKARLVVAGTIYVHELEVGR